MPSDNEIHLGNLQILLNSIRDNLVSTVNASSFPSNTRIPYRTLMLRESLLHRISDLGLISHDLFYEQKALAGLIITRSLLETISLLFLLTDRIKKTINSKDLESFSKYLLRLSLGSKNESTDIEAINVLTSIDIWVKHEEKIRELYETLSEFSHPNWWGNLAFMGTTDKENYQLNFGSEHGKWKSPLNMGILAVEIIIQNSIYVYDEMANILPEFIELCKTKNM